MPKNFSEFLTMMDERLWFRMVVCFLPPLLIVKLFGYTGDGSLINKVSTGVLLVGVAVYAFWAKIRNMASPIADDEEGIEDQAPVMRELTAAPSENSAGKQVVDLLSELRGLCQETERESDKLIAMELMVNPGLTFAEATRSAIARRKILGK